MKETNEPIDDTKDGALAQAQRGANIQAPKPAGDSNVDLKDSLYDQEFLNELVEAEKDLAEIDDERAELNARKGEITARLVNKGLNKDAVNAAIKYFRTEEDKRQNFDLSYAITRKALGVPIQDDLFVAAAQRAVDKHGRKKIN